MSFQSHLESVVSQVDGALACSVMGFDGIAVQTHQLNGADELDLSTALVEFTNVLSQLKSAAELLKTGNVQEISIHTEKNPCESARSTIAPRSSAGSFARWSSEK